MKKIVFLGAKKIGRTCLQFLLDHQDTYEAQVVAVLTNQKRDFGPENDLKGLATAHDIPVLEQLDELEQLEPFDFLISVQYHEILKQKHIDLAGELAINLHMAPLPEYRGCNQFSFAILDQKTEFGTTLHVMEAGIDSGAILSERRFPIAEGCMVKELFDETTDQSIELFCDEIGNVLQGNYTLIPQEALVDERGTSFHLRKDINDIKVIDLSWDAEKIERHYRATYNPDFAPPYALVDGQKVELTPDTIKSYL